MCHPIMDLQRGEKESSKQIDCIIKFPLQAAKTRHIKLALFLTYLLMKSLFLKVSQRKGFQGMCYTYVSSQLG